MYAELNACMRKLLGACIAIAYWLVFPSLCSSVTQSFMALRVSDSSTVSTKLCRKALSQESRTRKCDERGLHLRNKD